MNSDNCDKCASLCCVAPEIRHGSAEDYEGRPQAIIKETNTRCDNLTNIGKCSIYGNRGYRYTACTRYTCNDFGPRLTEYLRSHNLLEENGLLSKEGFHLFELLNGMLIRTFYGGGNTDLQDALDYYDKHKTWPKWMLTDEYYMYLRGTGILIINPRFKDGNSGIRGRFITLLKRGI